MNRNDKNQTSGVYFGNAKSTLRRVTGNNRFITKPSYEDGHVAICGGSGSGKTRHIVRPTLSQTWKGPFFAIDIKGDLEPSIAGEVKVLSLRGDTQYTYDPFEFIKEASEDDLISNIKEIVNSILPLPMEVKDPIWIESARCLLTAGILYYYKLDTSFMDAVTAIATTPPSQLIEEIANSGNLDAKMFITNFLTKAGDYNDDNDSYRTESSESYFVQADTKFLMGISQEITNRLSTMVTDGRIRSLLSQDENNARAQISWQDLESQRIILSIPEDRMEQYAPVTEMLLTQLIHSLERRPEKYSHAGKELSPILLMLDEFPRLGKLDIMKSALSTLRSKNVTGIVKKTAHPSSW